jgi:hypothetical protein
MAFKAGNDQLAISPMPGLTGHTERSANKLYAFIVRQKNFFIFMKFRKKR